jgi:transposase
MAISDEVKDIAWKAQQRLHKRYRAMAVRGKNKNQIVAALGRELARFRLGNRVRTEQQQKLGNAALSPLRRTTGQQSR